MPSKSNTIEFIKKAKLIHKHTLYNYNEVNYSNNRTKVKIICKIHGPFYQTPAGHLSKFGCPKCGGSEKSNTVDFIKKANLKHGENTYDYTEVNYVNSLTKVKIRCSIDDHGVFEQTPKSHLLYGCPKCGGTKKSNTDDFIKKAKLIHIIYNYDYKLVNYVGNKIKVKIVCNEHGIFEQSPNDHLNGSGCPLCLNKNEAETFRCLKLLFPNIKIHYQFRPYLNQTYEVDFYFEYNGKIYIVEYNGRQHYEATFWSNSISKDEADKALIKQQIRDQYGRDQCKKNNYNLIEIDWRIVSFNQIYNYLKNTYGLIL